MGRSGVGEGTGTAELVIAGEGLGEAAAELLARGWWEVCDGKVEVGATMAEEESAARAK